MLLFAVDPFDFVGWIVDVASEFFSERGFIFARACHTLSSLAGLSEFGPLAGGGAEVLADFDLPDLGFLEGGSSLSTGAAGSSSASASCLRFGDVWAAAFFAAAVDFAVPLAES